MIFKQNITKMSRCHVTYIYPSVEPSGVYWNTFHVHLLWFVSLRFFAICRTPRGLEDVSQYPELFATLLASGMWTIEDLKKLAGLNFLRVFREVERVSLKKIIALQSTSINLLYFYKNNIIKKPLPLMTPIFYLLSKILMN